jgi:hypothetical protein
MPNTNQTGTKSANALAAMMGNKLSLGHRHTDASKALMSAAKKGVPLSEKHKANMAMGREKESLFKGHSHTEEAKQQMSLSRKAKYAFRPKRLCEHCMKVYDLSIFAIAHGAKCKKRIT